MMNFNELLAGFLLLAAFSYVHVESVGDIQISLPKSIVKDLWRYITGEHIVVINNSKTSIQARVSDTLSTGSAGLFTIESGSSEKWNRRTAEVVRIFAFEKWHDFKLSEGSVVRLTEDGILQIWDPVAKNGHQCNAKKDGPHITG